MEVEIARGKELSQKQANDIAESETRSNPDEFVNRVSQNTFVNRKTFNNLQQQPNKNIDKRKCSRCGEPYSREHMKTCEAMGKLCYNCGKFNNLSKVCQKENQNGSKYVRNIENKNTDDNNNSSQENVSHIFSLSEKHLSCNNV